MIISKISRKYNYPTAETGTLVRQKKQCADNLCNLWQINNSTTSESINEYLDQLFVNMELSIQYFLFKNQMLILPHLKKNYHSKKSTIKSLVSSGLLFSIALLLLVVSCPVKKLFQNNLHTNTAIAIKGKQANINQRIHVEYSDASNCVSSGENTVLTKPDLSQQIKIQAPAYFPNIIQASGSDLNYFLSGISYNQNSNISRLSSVPLFLQHLSLLI